MNIESLLITPVQRLPRYVLLLGQLIDKTNPSMSDYECLLSSRRKMQVLLDFFNESKRRKEHMEESSIKLKEMKKSVYGVPQKILTTEHTYMKEGTVTLMVESGELHCYIYFFIDCIIIAKPRKKIENVRKHKSFKFHASRVFWLEDIELGPSEEDDTVFFIKVKKDSLMKEKYSYKKRRYFIFKGR